MLSNCGAGELLRIPWTARRSKQLILKEINPEYSLEGLMVKLKLQYFGHLRQTADSLEKTLMLGKIEGRRRRGWQDEMVGWHHWFIGHELGANSGRWWGTEKPGALQSVGSRRARYKLATEQQHRVGCARSRTWLRMSVQYIGWVHTC